MLLVILGFVFWLFSKPGKQHQESKWMTNRQDAETKVPTPPVIPRSPKTNSVPVSRPVNDRVYEKARVNSKTSYNYDIVGESYRRENLLEIINNHDAISIGKLHVEAILDPEPSNPFDENAVKVLIDGKHVGYIPKSDSKRVSNLISESGLDSMKVKARIGWDKNQTTQFIGVKIALD